MAEDGIISSRDEIFPVNSLVAYPCLGLFSPRNEEKIGRGDRLRAEEKEREEEEEEEVCARGPPSGFLKRAERRAGSSGTRE